MNIGFVSIYDFGYPGGVNLHVANLAEQFSKEGHRVRIIAPCSRDTDQFGKDKLIPLGWSIPLHTAGTTARIVLSMRLANKVKPLLERENFDLIHYHEPLCPTLPTTILRNSNAVNVATFHAFHGTRRVVGVSCADRAYTIFNRYVRKHWLSRLHAKIAVSQAALEFVSNHFPGDYTIIPNGIDLERFHPDVKPIEQFNDGYVNILFVGRMEKRKGLKYLLNAYSKLKWDYPKIRLLIVGPGNMDSDSERIMGERSLADKDVKVIGNVSHDELPRYYRTADIYCSPATGKESFGIVLLEGMASRAAVVASDIIGYAGVISDGVQGFLVPPKDDAALASALARLIEDNDLRKAMADRGLAHVQEFSWDKVSTRVMSVYQEATVTRRDGALSTPS